MTKFIPNPLYHQILEHVPIACVDIAIVANGAVLLVKRKDAPAKGQWWLPGGRVIKGEMMRETAARKAREEVGLECHVGPIIHTAETIFPDGPNGIPVHSINSCFFIYPVDPDFVPRLDEHHQEYRWVSQFPLISIPMSVAASSGPGLNTCRSEFVLPAKNENRRG